MARIDELLEQVDDAALRAELTLALKDLRSRKQFGLVFEEHIPEMSGLPGLSPEVDSLAQLVVDPAHPLVRVRGRTGEEFEVEFVHDGSTRQVSRGDLVAVKRFGEAIFPALANLGSVVRGEDLGRPHHLVMNGENYHALQLLLYLYERQVDCIYIDPPYNTGAKDWKYNNNYVDQNDGWRHSKWLSMMHKRLVLARRLLKDDGVLVVTIDEHEVHHLALLLEELFPNYRRPMVTIVMNSAGNTQGGFYRVEEHAIFCFPPGRGPNMIRDDLLAPEGKKPRSLWGTHIRSGGINDLPSKRSNLVYPIAIDEANGKFFGCGASLEDRLSSGELGDIDRSSLDNWRPDPDETLYGHHVLWPFSEDGSLGTWRNDAQTFASLVREGFVRIRPNESAPGTNRWSVSYVTKGNRQKVEDGIIPILGRDDRDGSLLLGDERRPVIPKTVWKRRLHDATNWGSPILKAFAGSTSFTYPKSPYAVRDTLSTLVGERTDALIVDFFAGSGTTLQAACMLNAIDGGQRRCILVTNNEVSSSDAQRLRSDGYRPGDAEWEELGIFEHVTRPRCEAVVTGRARDGSPIKGQYEDGTPYSEGFHESVTFFRLDYLDPDQVELGHQFDAIHPTLWAAAGAIGKCPSGSVGDADFVLPNHSNYGVLFSEARFKEFRSLVVGLDSLSHVWLITNSEPAFAEMRESLPGHLKVSMLYRDYLRNFEINTEERLR